MATLFNQGTLLYTPADGSAQRVAVSNTTSTTVDVTYGLNIAHGASPLTYATGDTVGFSVVVTNTGSGSLSDVRIVVEANDELDYVPGSAEAFLYNGTTLVAYPFTVEQGSIVFVFSEPLPGGSTLYLTYQATVNATADDSITSTATVTAYEGDATGALVTDSASVTLTRAALTVVKSAPESAEVGQTIAFAFTVQNTAGEPVSLDTLTDRLPDGFSFVSLSLVINGAGVPLTAGVDYTVSPDGLLTVTPASTVFIPAGGQAVFTITGVVTA